MSFLAWIDIDQADRDRTRRDHGPLRHRRQP